MKTGWLEGEGTACCFAESFDAARVCFCCADEHDDDDDTVIVGVRLIAYVCVVP